MDENKKNKIIIAILTALIVILFVIIIYALYDKGFIFNKKQSTSKNTESKKNVVELLSGEEKDLLVEKIKGINTFAGYYPLDDVKKIPNQEVLYDIIFELGFGMPISERAINEKIEYYFGESYNLKNEDLICTVDNRPLYLYDANRKSYIYDTNSLHGHGGHGSVRDIVVKYIDGKKENDEKITINTKLVYATYCGDTCGPNFAYYKSYEDSVKNQNPILGETDSDTEIKLTTALYKTIESKLPVTTFTFTKKDSSTYNLESVTIN